MNHVCLKLITTGILAAFLSQSLADDVGLRPGQIVKDELSVGQGQARVAIPLPSGEWQVFRVDEIEMRVSDPASQHLAPISLDIHLVQREGRRLVMAMRIQASKDVVPGRITQLNVHDPCKRKDTLYRNPYDSGGAVVHCLLVNHLVGYLRGARSGVFADLRNWMMKEGIDIPRTALSATFAQSQTRHFLTVTIYVNPATRDLDATETSWLANPFHRDLVANDPARDRYVKDFIAWSEAYMPLISISRPSAGGIRPVTAFR